MLIYTVDMKPFVGNIVTIHRKASIGMETKENCMNFIPHHKRGLTEKKVLSDIYFKYF